MKKTIITFLLLVICNITGYSKEPSAGYRGFVEWDNSYGPNVEGILSSFIYTGISTSHGYQFNRNIYLGAGFDISIGYPGYMVPIFTDFRFDKAFGSFTPYVDIRLGYNIAIEGLYFSPTIGYRINWGRKTSFNIGVGATLLGRDEYKTMYYGNGKTEDSYINSTYEEKIHRLYPLFSLRLGFDF